ncbi:alkaline phosphatase [Sphingobacterium cellulitidis]|uniref:metallophosphoesterase family protein n=1 Tax=Sphingobacterium cellulitidis TaxID=1768011 RepID=UPI000B9424F3|nr:metallophosphoesterase [Sphingobacterium cellulitidis]OYD44569.1 alkaline phosphatase [Sphingobacterium cellulitidis]
MNKNLNISCNFSRKDFLKISGIGLGSLLIPTSVIGNSGFLPKKRVIKFGVISDLHFDLMHDASDRAQKFVDHMISERPDFIIQLGDFCMPKPQNKKLMDIWNQFPGDKYHVLGNHDTDSGFTKEQALNFWNCPSAYYSFDKEGFHFVVLDGNEKVENSQVKGYPREIAKVQLDWLKEDLSKTNLRTIIFCHQGFDNSEGGIENGMRVRHLFEQINKEAGFKKVILVLSGHHHSNYHNEINGIHYVQINSSSYYWVNENYNSKAFNEEFYKKYPLLKYTIVYKDPIWALIGVDHKNNISIKGKESSFVGQNQSIPEDLADIYPVSAKIDSRKLKY